MGDILATLATMRFLKSGIFWTVVLAFLVFVSTFVFLRHLEGPVTCRDGWPSPSIGRQGACSWHRGVDHKGGLAFLGAMFAVWGFFAFLVWIAERFPSKPKDAAETEPQPSLIDEEVPFLAPRLAGAGEVACPNCGGPMVIRIAKRGGRKGRPFRGCEFFPRCRGTRYLNRFELDDGRKPRN